MLLLDVVESCKRIVQLSKSLIDCICFCKIRMRPLVVDVLINKNKQTEVC